MGLAAADTLASEVPLTSAAQIAEDGSFSGLVDGGSLSPGEYVVVAEACYGQGNCGLGFTTIGPKRPSESR